MSAEAADRVAPPTESCRFCWMCRHVCPVGLVTSRETLTPHAWALTIESVRRGQLAWNEETANVMYACADCGLCRTHCVTDQPLPDAIVAARAEIVRAGAAPAAVREIRHALEASRPSAVVGSFGTGRRRVLFVGDAPGESTAGEVRAALGLLDAAGMPATPDSGGRSSGLAASSLGLVDLATDLAREVIAAVASSGASEVLVLRPADKWTFEYVYPKRLGLEWPTGVAVTEVTTALARALDEGRLRVGRRNSPPPAYHDPCHGPRSGRDASAPRRLLAAVHGRHPARELFWRADRAHPCGAIGELTRTHPDISRRLTTARIEDAAATGATTLVTDDPTCLTELRQHAANRLQVVGLYSLLLGHVGS